MHEILQVLPSHCFPNGSNSKVNVSFIYSSYHFYFDIFRLNSSHCLFNRMGMTSFHFLNLLQKMNSLTSMPLFYHLYVCAYISISISMDETM